MGSRLWIHSLVAAAIFLGPPLLAATRRLLHPATWAGFVFGVTTLATQPALSPKSLVTDTSDRLSALAILIAVIASNLGSAMEFSLRARLFPAPTSWWVIVGVGIGSAGLMLRLWAIRTLGSFFTSTVQVQPEQPVMSDGPYRLLRHPSYTGSLLTALGTAVAFGSPAGVALVCTLALPAYLYRIRIEERALLAALGVAYAEYRSRTWGLLPLVV
jgi:protein-S-isoprenylcysteine O-methyltransferase